MSERQPLLEQNLLLSFEELAQRLLARLRTVGDAQGFSIAQADRSRHRDEDLLDCFLIAAGLSQILEDHLHRHFFGLGQASRHLAGLVPVVGPLAAKAAGAANRAGVGFRARLPRGKRLTRRRNDLALLLRGLADEVLVQARGGPRGTGEDSSGLTHRFLELAETALLPSEQLPLELRQTIVRLPNCFRSFDQRPEDCLRLVDRFSVHSPDRGRPLLVVGLRTSGSYLAPLVASCLATAGYTDVAAATIRPGFLIGDDEAQALAHVAKAGGLVLIVDDPPRSGAQLAQATRELMERGVSPDSIVLLLQHFDSRDALPEAIRAHTAVCLPWDEWTIHEHFSAAALESALNELLVGREVSVSGRPEIRVASARIEEVTLFPPSRGHGRAVSSVRLIDEAGDAVSKSICSEGTGLGYFGRHALAIAKALDGSVPEVFGFRDGVLFREWLPEERRISPARLSQETQAISKEIAGYVQRRNSALAVREDVSLRLVGRDAAWELIANMLGDAFGMAKQFVRPLTHAAARRIVRVAQPSVTDGDTAPWKWFGVSADSAEDLSKVDFNTRAFSNAAIYSCDPILDLAGAAAAGEAHGIGESAGCLRQSYEELTGEPVGDERWLVYRLVHLLAEYSLLLRETAADPARGDASFTRLLALERTMAAMHQRYIESRYFSDLEPVSTGPLCAIDIDGVLETRWTAFPALAPAGALALRALNRHGYRVILATGRSLAEVRERSHAYRLAGGVAEYGSVVYNHLAGTEHSLLTDGHRDALSALREALQQSEAVYLDPPYRHSVRAHTLNAAGKRSALAEEAVATALAGREVEARIRPILGDLQTDFVGATIDKGSGIRALAADFGDSIESTPLLALAIGDTASDLPVLELARYALAPANASRDLHGQVRVLRRSYQSGLLQAVSLLLGHRPSHCRTCRPPRPPTADARLFLGFLAALNGGKSDKARRALALAGPLLAG